MYLEELKIFRRGVRLLHRVAEKLKEKLKDAKVLTSDSNNKVMVLYYPLGSIYLLTYFKF